jgi:hypothetical protein
VVEISYKLKNFRHNNLDLSSIRIAKNKNKKIYKIGDTSFEIDNKYIIKLTNFENATCDNFTKIFQIKNSKSR